MVNRPFTKPLSCNKVSFMGPKAEGPMKYFPSACLCVCFYLYTFTGTACSFIKFFLLTLKQHKVEIDAQKFRDSLH